MMMRLLLLLITCATLFAQRTPLKVNGTIVNNPNLTNSATVTYTVNGANVSAAATGGTAGTVINTGTPASGQLPLYSDTTGTNIAPSSANAILFDGTQASRTLTFNISGTDPILTSANNLLSLNTPFTTGGSLTVSSGFISAIGSGGALSLSSGGTISFNGRSNIRSDDSSTIQQGADAASPAAQRYKGADATGTDNAGGSFTIGGGNSTGTGRPGALIGETSLVGTTGSTANTPTKRFYYEGKPTALSEGSATEFVSIAVPAGKFVGATITATVNASDGTDFQSRTLVFTVSAVNKAGTVTAGVSTPVESVGVSAGTLTCTITAVADGATVEVEADATSSLTQTTLNCTWAITALHSDDIASVAPL